MKHWLVLSHMLVLARGELADTDRKDDKGKDVEGVYKTDEIVAVREAEGMAESAVQQNALLLGYQHRKEIGDKAAKKRDKAAKKSDSSITDTHEFALETPKAKTKAVEPFSWTSVINSGRFKLGKVADKLKVNFTPWEITSWKMSFVRFFAAAASSGLLLAIAKALLPAFLATNTLFTLTFMGVGVCVFFFTGYFDYIVKKYTQHKLGRMKRELEEQLRNLLEKFGDDDFLSLVDSRNPAARIGMARKLESFLSAKQFQPYGYPVPIQLSRSCLSTWPQLRKKITPENMTPHGLFRLTQEIDKIEEVDFPSQMFKLSFYFMLLLFAKSFDLETD